MILIAIGTSTEYRQYLLSIYMIPGPLLCALCVFYLHSNQWSCCCSVMSNSLQPHGLQHNRPPCPLLSPGVCPGSCALHQWYKYVLLINISIIVFLDKEIEGHPILQMQELRIRGVIQNHTASMIWIWTQSNFKRT